MRTSKYAGFLPDVNFLLPGEIDITGYRMVLLKLCLLNSLFMQKACLDFFFDPAQGAKKSVP